MDRYAVIGNPIAHSLSPRIHQLFAANCGHALTYDPVLAPRDGFEPVVRAFFAAGGSGMNVTLPFKQDAFALADQHGRDAMRAGAVNTLSKRGDGRLVGDNTDGIGLMRDLAKLSVYPSERQVLILGAGGAVRGVLPVLLESPPRRVVIANRTRAKAEALAAAMSGYGEIEVRDFLELAGEQFDLVINGTAASLADELPPLPDDLLATKACCYDMVYDLAKPTAFLRWGQSRNAACCADGLGMLIEQAAAAFALWRGVLPPTDPIRAALRADAPDGAMR